MTATSDPSFGWSIGVLFRSWQEGASRALVGVPHGARGFQILATVAHDEPPTQASLAAHLGIDRTVLTYVIDDLVDAGVIERTVDPADRRVRRLAATPAGRDLLAQLEQRVADAERELLDGLSDREQEQLRTALHRAASRIHRADPGHDTCSVVADVLTGRA
ncbi:MarR family winged helix-turn-helix transcriptional regulator [Nakamurella sp. GG22]